MNEINKQENKIGLSNLGNNSLKTINNEILDKVNALSIDFSNTIVGDVLDLPYSFSLSEEAYQNRRQQLEGFKKIYTDKYKTELVPIKNQLNEITKPIRCVIQLMNKQIDMAKSRLETIAVNCEIIDKYIGIANGAKPKIIFTDRKLDEIDENLLWSLYEAYAEDVIKKELIKGHSKPKILGLEYEINLEQ